MTSAWHDGPMSHGALTMVGRDAELSALRDLWADVAEEGPRTVIVAGEAGIGKSRLLDEFRREAEQTEGAIAAVGQCVESATVDIPYAPLAGVFRAIERAIGPEAFLGAAGVGGPVLRSLAEGAPSARGQGGLDRLDEVVTILLETLSAERPLLVLVEDLHWADAATLDVLRFATRVQRTGHLLLVLSYRTDDVERTHPLRQLLADLDRNPRSQRLSLQRLSAREVRAQAHDILGAVPEPADARRLFERSEGVPFFVEELLALGTTSEVVPRSSARSAARPIRHVGSGGAADRPDPRGRRRAGRPRPVDARCPR